MPGINLTDLASGAVQERFDLELQKVFDNILDPNTDWKKARKLQLTLTFKTNEDRDITHVNVDAKTALVPAFGIYTKFWMDRDQAGHAAAAEVSQGRLFDEVAVTEQAEAPNTKVSYLEQKQSGRV